MYFTQSAPKMFNLFSAKGPCVHSGFRSVVHDLHSEAILMRKPLGSKSRTQYTHMEDSNNEVLRLRYLGCSPEKHVCENLRDRLRQAGRRALETCQRERQTPSESNTTESCLHPLKPEFNTGCCISVDLNLFGEPTPNRVCAILNLGPSSIALKARSAWEHLEDAPSQAKSSNLTLVRELENPFSGEEYGREE